MVSLHSDSCDSLRIITDNENTTLNLYKWSDDIIIKNPIGYNVQNLNCTPLNAYLILNESFQSLYTSISSIFNNLPCLNTKFICNETESCTVEYNEEFSDAALNYFYNFMNCYGPI